MQVAMGYYSTGGRVKLGSFDGCSTLQGRRVHRRGTVLVNLGCFLAGGSLLLGFGSSRDGVRLWSTGTMRVTVGCFPSDALFLDFDSCTQSLKATAIDAELCLYKTAKMHHDFELSHYGTKDGVHGDPHVKGRTTAIVLMWVEALDIMTSCLLSWQRTISPFTKCTPYLTVLNNTAVYNESKGYKIHS